MGEKVGTFSEHFGAGLRQLMNIFSNNQRCGVFATADAWRFAG